MQLTFTEAFIEEASRVAVKTIFPKEKVLALHFLGKNKIELSRHELIKAINFYLDCLISKRLKNSLTIFIRFKPHDLLHGECTWIDTNIRPREFEIMINSDLSREDILRALAHELVHIKQYAKSEMQDYLKQGMAKWFGEKLDFTKISYNDQPWEEEAYRLEEVLYERLNTPS